MGVRNRANAVEDKLGGQNKIILGSKSLILGVPAWKIEKMRLLCS